MGGLRKNCSSDLKKFEKHFLKGGQINFWNNILHLGILFKSTRHEIE